MKRFTETTKWENVWFSELTTPQKLLWMFMLDKSDASGVWEPNWKLASFMIGAELKESDLDAFGDRIQILESGKVLIVPFVQFQYGKLSPQCRPHLKVFESMQKHGLECEDGIVFPSRSRPSNLTERKRLSVFERDGNVCVYCGRSGELEVDHIVPRQRGGKDAFSNLASACHECNARKGTHEVDEFIETLEDPKSAKQRLSQIAKYPTLVGYLDRVQDKEEEEEKEKDRVRGAGERDGNGAKPKANPRVRPGVGSTPRSTQTVQGELASGCSQFTPPLTNQSPDGGAALESESRHTKFIRLWCERFKSHFNEEYEFVGGRDGKAVKALIKNESEPIEEIIRTAERAWSIQGFVGQSAAVIHSFHDQRMKIIQALKCGQQGNGQHHPEAAKRRSANEVYGQ